MKICKGVIDVRMVTCIKQFIHRTRYKSNCTIGKKITLDSHCEFEGKNRITNNCVVLNTKMGYASYIGQNSYIKNTRIGRYTCIASEVMTVPGNHPTSQFASIHPAFYSTRRQSGFTYVKEDKFSDFNYVDPENKISVIIGNDVWIGEGVKIVEGVTIGDGAVVATGAIVTKDVEPYSIVGGVPAKHLKYRFDEATREQLLELRWWDKGEEWIKAHADEFENVEQLISRTAENGAGGYSYKLVYHTFHPSIYVSLSSCSREVAA